MKRILIITGLFPLLSLSACGSGGDSTDTEQPVVRGDPSSQSLHRATADERDRFTKGDRLFELTMREPDGLGPLYIEAACGGCHKADSRGPGLVGKLAVVDVDGWTPATQQTDLLPYGGTERLRLAAGAKTPITRPDGQGSVRLTFRLAPAVFGRGYVEAIADEEIEGLEREQAKRSDGIRGVVHRVTYNSEPNPETPFHNHTKGQMNLIGRFGLKARIATLDEFAADAFQGDMGMTSPMRPMELPNPDGLTDDGKPGVDLTLAEVNAVGDYMRLLEIPTRKPPTTRERALFDQALCSVCHVPSLKTRKDYPIAALAGIDAPVYTDVLLHDMGTLLADGLVDGKAGSRQWKTAPLIGLRFFPAFLHDGRAHSVEEAILGHEGPGSEANGSVGKFKALSTADRAELIKFVSGL